MSWFRSAAIYLVLTAIILGAVWLFWGKDLETAWKKMRENPKDIAQKKAELKKTELPKLPGAIAAAEKLPANAAAEWKKTRSGAEGLVEVQKYENRRDLQTLAGKNDSRMIEILKTVKLYKEPKPAIVPAVAPLPVPLPRSGGRVGDKGEVNAVKPLKKKTTAKETAKSKKESEKNKAALQPML